MVTKGKYTVGIFLLLSSTITLHAYRIGRDTNERSRELSRSEQEIRKAEHRMTNDQIRERNITLGRLPAPATSTQQRNERPKITCKATQASYWARFWQTVRNRSVKRGYQPIQRTNART